MAYQLTYCGGIPEIKKPGEVSVKVSSDSVYVSANLLKNATIRFDVMSNVSMKTDEQISKDITLTRLLTLGVFAFGAKKKTKTVTNHLVIEYDCGGVQTAAIFAGNSVAEVNSEILKRRMKFLKKTPPPAPAKKIPLASPVPSVPSASVADELLKLKSLLDIGALTQGEFDAQKEKLLQ
jgi:hypothetical protein